MPLSKLEIDSSFHDYFTNEYKCLSQTASVMRKFSASRHFFKTNVTQSVDEFILYSQKTRNCGHFLSNLAGLRRKNI